MVYSKASIRIFTLEPNVDFISFALNVLPHSFGLVGQPVSSFNPTASRRSESIWRYESTLPDTSPLDDHISKLCSVISQGMEQLRVIKSRLICCDVFCMLASDNGQGGGSISSQNMKILGDADFEIFFDVHVSEE